jgi:hypothetical protein
MRSSTFFTWSTLFLLFCENVHGFSSGTGACDGGEAPLGTASGGSTHVRATGQILGPLSDYGVELILNDSIVQPDTPTSFPPNVDLTWTVRTEDPIQYKGILVRAEAVESIDFTLTTTDALLKQETTYCPLQGNVAGITHTTSALKSSSSGVLRFDATGTATLDVTVVYRNGATGSPPENQSITGYNRFSLTIEAPQVPVATPVAAPTNAPVEAPVATPVETPVEAPVDAPVEAPTESPVESPTELPVEPPSESPVEAPVKSPTKKGTKPPKVMGKMDIKGTKVNTSKDGMGRMDTKGEKVKTPKDGNEKAAKTAGKKENLKKGRFLR